MSSLAPVLYLLDVEGTVAPVTLTTEVLFPYAREHVEEFLKRSLAGVKAISKDGEPPRDDSVLSDLWLLWSENWAEQEADAPRMIESLPPGFPKGEPGKVSIGTAIFVPRALEYIYWLMDRDRKSTALKSLQGKIWKAGFESGELKGTLFADVPEAFARWARVGRVAIYSSGSVEAQKLLFRYSNFGDLTPLISGYFDTRTGAKRERASYAAIARAMQVAPGEVIFFSDVVAELDAAREAGCDTRLVVREGNAPVPDTLDAAHGHELIESLENL
jgi:2,3-diketo-5-methylthio-1-phosphopentane phosphatase